MSFLTYVSYGMLHTWDKNKVVILQFPLEPSRKGIHIFLIYFGTMVELNNKLGRRE